MTTPDPRFDVLWRAVRRAHTYNRLAKGETMLSDPYEACEAAGLAAEAELVACDDCGQYYDETELWSCWPCMSHRCDGCVDAHGHYCDHFREDWA